MKKLSEELRRAIQDAFPKDPFIQSYAENMDDQALIKRLSEKTVPQVDHMLSVLRSLNTSSFNHTYLTNLIEGEYSLEDIRKAIKKIRDELFILGLKELIETTQGIYRARELQKNVSDYLD